MQQASETGVSLMSKTASVATYGGAGNGLAITYYFKQQHLLIAKQAAKADPDE
jgi:hypothetical protein